MGPGADQPRALISERGELDLQHALAGLGALAEDLQDQAGPVDDLGLPEPLEIALLHRRQRGIDDHQLGRLEPPVPGRAPWPCPSRAASPALSAQAARALARRDLQVDRAREARPPRPDSSQACDQPRRRARRATAPRHGRRRAPRRRPELRRGRQPCGCGCSSADGS